MADADTVPPKSGNAPALCPAASPGPARCRRARTGPSAAPPLPAAPRPAQRRAADAQLYAERPAKRRPSLGVDGALLIEAVDTEHDGSSWRRLGVSGGLGRDRGEWRVSAASTAPNLWTMTIRYPQPLKPGDRVGVTSPSSGVAADLRARLTEAVRVVEAHGFEVVVGECMDGSGHLSAPAPQRAAELTAMLLDPAMRPSFLPGAARPRSTCCRCWTGTR